MNIKDIESRRKSNTEMNSVMNSEKVCCSIKFNFRINLTATKVKNNEAKIITLMISKKFSLSLISLNCGIINIKQIAEMK